MVWHTSRMTATDPETVRVSEALDALKESLSLSEMEMEQVAQSLRDMKSLEDALRAIQKAKAANKFEALDGEQNAGCKDMEEYEKLQELVEAVSDDVRKASGGNKAAGTRVRKSMQDIKDAAQSVRKRILEVRSQQTE